VSGIDGEAAYGTSLPQTTHTVSLYSQVGPRSQDDRRESDFHSEHGVPSSTSGANKNAGKENAGLSTTRDSKM